MKNILRNFGLLIIIVLAAMACGCPGGNNQTESTDDVAEISQGEIPDDSPAVEPGSSVSGSESVVQPDITGGWPEYVPIMPGSEVRMVTTSADGSRLLMLECPAELTEVDAYYAGVLAENGWTAPGGRFEMRDADGFTLTYEREGEVLRLQGSRSEGKTELTMSIFSQGADYQN